MNKGKLNLPPSPLPSFPGYNPLLWNNPKEFTDLGSKESKVEDYWPTWDKRLEMSRTNQINATQKIVENSKNAYSDQL
uniref:Uncharacterized protein n=1 Tax=Physcomitrium patens TaxID=3218 RepID=A0A2K1IN85_PHYPA|nr:hypothetical protein PHYPA_027062 [Physcomitrium patens]